MIETTSPQTLLILFVGLVLLGLGLLVWLLRYIIRGIRQGEKKRVDAPPAPFTEEPPAAVPDAEPEPVTAPQVAETPPTPATHIAEESPRAPAPSPIPAGEPGDRLLMQVWQDREGFLVVEMDGQRYRRLFDIRDGTVGRRVMEVINRLGAFSKGQASRVTPLPAEPLGEAPHASTPTLAESQEAVVPLSPDAVVQVQSQAFIEKLKEKEQDESQPRKSRISADPVPFRSRSDSRDSHITLNLADEIDQLVQVRIQTFAEFRGRGIHVTSAPDGALRFEMDGIRYTSLDEIPDSQVQALIRAAISDWEVKR